MLGVLLQEVREAVSERSVCGRSACLSDAYHHGDHLDKEEDVRHNNVNWPLVTARGYVMYECAPGTGELGENRFIPLPTLSLLLLLLLLLGFPSLAVLSKGSSCTKLASNKASSKWWLVSSSPNTSDLPQYLSILRSTPGPPGWIYRCRFVPQIQRLSLVRRRRSAGFLSKCQCGQSKFITFILLPIAKQIFPQGQQPGSWKRAWRLQSFPFLDVISPGLRSSDVSDLMLDRHFRESGAAVAQQNHHLKDLDISSSWSTSTTTFSCRSVMEAGVLPLQTTSCSTSAGVRILSCYFWYRFIARVDCSKLGNAVIVCTVCAVVLESLRTHSQSAGSGF
jgi:hypothetical protein